MVCFPHTLRQTFLVAACIPKICFGMWWNKVISKANDEANVAYRMAILVSRHVATLIGIPDRWTATARRIVTQCPRIFSDSNVAKSDGLIGWPSHVCWLWPRYTVQTLIHSLAFQDGLSLLLIRQWLASFDSQLSSRDIRFVCACRRGRSFLFGASRWIVILSESSCFCCHCPWLLKLLLWMGLMDGNKIMIVRVILIEQHAQSIHTRR